MRVLEAKPIKGHFNIALVASIFNSDITDKLVAGALERLTELGFSSDQIVVARVPGAVEIPITAQRFAKSGAFDAIIALGAVIFGETKHFEYVCNMVSEGCQTVALTHNLPVIFGVLTTETKAQAEDRTGGRKGHMGREAADAAYQLVSVLRQI